MSVRFDSVRSSFRSASIRRALYLATPAASSKMVRRSCGEASSIASTLPCSMIEYASAPMPVSRNRSTMSLSRQRLELMRYCEVPSRNSRRSTSTVSASMGKARLIAVREMVISVSGSGLGSRVSGLGSESEADTMSVCSTVSFTGTNAPSGWPGLPSPETPNPIPDTRSSTTGLSNVSTTLAIPSGRRPPEPAKMTSVISLPRKDLLERSPSTHLMASTTLDLPQPLGPTMPVMGSSNRNSVRSANDLNPLRVSLARRIRGATSMSPAL